MMPPSTAGSHAIGVDVGGTNVRALAVDGVGAVLRRGQAPSPVGDASALVDRIAQVVDGLDMDAPVGLGIAGLVDREGRLATSPNLGLADVPLAAMLTRRLGRPVSVINDAAAAALAEHHRGAASDATSSVTVTIGTGIGAGIIDDGRVVLGATGFSAELGHLVVDPDGTVCACGRRGCLETVASGSAIDRQASRIGLDGAPAAIAAAEAGDRRAQRILADAGDHLGRALAAVVTIVDPGVVVLGGGAGSALARWFAPRIGVQLDDLVFAAPLRTLPAVVLAALGDDAGAVGAALMAVAPDVPPTRQREGR